MQDKSATKHTSLKLKKGDEVMIMTGRSKGSTGKIDRINRKNLKVFVSGANMYKKHQKPDVNSPEGGIIEKPMPVHLSNVMLVDPKNGKPSRVGFKVVDGKKTRFSKSSGATLES